MNVYKKLRILRPYQWAKSVFIWVGIAFSGAWELWPLVLIASIAFMLVSGGVYIYNDLSDLAEDKVHPVKRLRPLPAGDISQRECIILMSITLALGLGLAYSLSYTLLAILLSYLALNILYNHGVKQLAGVDVCFVALGFYLRVLAGTSGVGIPPSLHLAFSAFLLSLYIALVKRYLELHIQCINNGIASKKYSLSVLTNAIYIVGLLSLFVYGRYLFLVHSDNAYYIFSFVPAIIALLYFTYLTVVLEQRVDDPLRVLLKNWVMLLLVALFSWLVIIGQYQGK